MPIITTAFIILFVGFVLWFFGWLIKLIGLLFSVVGLVQLRRWEVAMLQDIGFVLVLIFVVPLLWAHWMESRSGAGRNAGARR